MRKETVGTIRLNLAMDEEREELSGYSRWTVGGDANPHTVTDAAPEYCVGMRYVME
jgi:hypothetical protein